LLVVCPDPAVAAWCAAPVLVGEPNLVLTPLVLGPAQIPVVTDPVLARRSPELAVLSALAHGARPGQTGVFEALLAALDVIDLDHASLYADVVLAALPTAARDCLEDLMTTTSHPYQSDFARRYYDRGAAEGEARGEAKGEAKGQAKGEARAVLAVLDARGIEVSDRVRERVAGCTDVGQLDAWLRVAATGSASEISALFQA